MAHTPHYVQLASYIVNEHILNIGNTVEYRKNLSELIDSKHQPFLQIRDILRDSITGEVFLEGWLFKRCSSMGGILPRKRNEVCLILAVYEDDAERPFEQGMVKIPADLVIGVRQLEKTNTRFPERSFRFSLTPRTEVLDCGKLVCRWVQILRFSDARHKKDGKFRTLLLRPLLQEECDTTLGAGVNASKLFKHWRGMLPEIGHRYTFADAFAGAGGVSEGAAQAGLSVKIAFDSNAQAVSTFRLNRAATDIYHASVDQFLSIVEHTENYHVDVLHISSPCQWCSPANTRGGPDDEENRATMYAAEELVRKLRPRAVTLEQTFGIFTHHNSSYKRLLNMFTSCEYSVRSRILNFEDYGVCQSGHRLILLAACPGSTLPDFPRETHGNDRDFAPSTIADALLPLIVAESSGASIPNHNPSECPQRYKAPFDPYTSISTITTSGTITLKGASQVSVDHYNGRRCWTVRELACFQTFPLTFKFPSTNEQPLTAVRRQIGNAVPPLIARLLLEEVTRTLRNDDLRFTVEDAQTPEVISLI